MSSAGASVGDGTGPSAQTSSRPSPDAPWLAVEVLGVGLLGPGLPGWTASREPLTRPAAWTAAPVTVPSPARLPPAERRRAGPATKLALAVADEACAAAAARGIDAASLATVFVSADGDAANCHAVCEALAQSPRFVSPTRFTNSVHNATAGFWHIALASRAPSTSLAAWQAGAALGLLEAASQCLRRDAPVLLVCSDQPLPPPLAALRPVHETFAFALVVAPRRAEAAIGLRGDAADATAGPRALRLALRPVDRHGSRRDASDANESCAASGAARPASMDSAGPDAPAATATSSAPGPATPLAAQVASVPAAHALPLLSALAAPAAASVALRAWPGTVLAVEVDAADSASPSGAAGVGG